MMDRQTKNRDSLPQDVVDIIWRVVGSVESPLSQETTLRLINQIVREYAGSLPSSGQDQAISDICAWFEFHEEKGWLREDVRELVASMIVSGIKDVFATRERIDNREIAFCAVGSIEPDTALNMIKHSWSHEDIDAFVHYAFKVLKMLCSNGAVLNPGRVEGHGFAGARSYIGTIQKGEILETYWSLKDYDWWLYPSISNMVELLMKLNSDHFYTFINEIDHPVIHLRAARCFIDMDASADRYIPLQWLTQNSPDPIVALVIVHILSDVNRLDSGLLRGMRHGCERTGIDAENYDLIHNMIEKLGKLEPTKCSQWIVELLDYRGSMLNASSGGEKPTRVEQLDKLCCEQLKRLTLRFWSDELLETLRFALPTARWAPRVLPLAQVAYDIQELEPARSAEIVHIILDTHEQQIAKPLDDHMTFFYDSRYWDHRDWVNGLAIALVLSDGEIDLLDWVSEKCRVLPLSIWDAEENLQRFLNAEKIAQFRYLVAFHAIQMLSEVGRIVDSARSLALVESFWSHCQFSERHILAYDSSDVAEYAARIAVQLGSPSGIWILDQAENAGVSPRALWALIHQYISNNAERIESNDMYQLNFMSQLRYIVAARFGNTGRLELTQLYYLGELWLLLESDEQAEAVAMAITSFPPRVLSRPYKVIALKLLAFASSNRRLAPESKNNLDALYSELWTSYPSDEERAERREIDALLQSS